jgi:acyl carrier protein
MPSVEDRVRQVTARVLNVSGDAIKPADNFTVDLGAESVQAIELVASFEEEFGIEMDEEEALGVENFGGAVEYITKVCKEQGIEA